MSTELNINQNVEELIANIIKENKLPKDSHITYDTGSELGDGFLSQNLAVSISNDKQSLELFIKCGFDVDPSAFMPIDKFYANEIHFYDVVAPTYLKFVEEKNIKDGFRHIPKCYGTSKKNIIALENIKKKGYALCNKAKPLNEEHITLVLKTFAKFHAISFAYKDQRREEYDKLIEPTVGTFDDTKNEERKRMFEINIENFLSSLDPVKDKHILDRSDNLANRLFAVGEEAIQQKCEDSILTQGDCWCNNMMFLYEDKNEEHPTDVILVDWQIIRQTQPVMDVSYFFYTVASQEALDNVKQYLKVYHEELTQQIRKLGSDPDILYPFSLMEKQWKETCKFGLYMAFLLLRLMLSEKDETIDLVNVDFENAKQEEVFPTLKNNDEYYKRLRMIMEHMIANDFL